MCTKLRIPGRTAQYSTFIPRVIHSFCGLFNKPSSTAKTLLFRFLLPTGIALLLAFSPAQAQYADLAELQRLAETGEPYAQLNLGSAYDQGLLGLKPNAQAAVQWFRLSAKQGVMQAQFNLAHCLATGHGVEQDYTQARFWMAKAAAQKDADAQFLLGVLMAEGLGGDIDQAGAIQWIRRAARQGNEEARNYLERLK